MLDQLFCCNEDSPCEPHSTLYPAFESEAGSTFVREQPEVLDSIDVWRLAVRLQVVRDRCSGLV